MVTGGLVAAAGGHDKSWGWLGGLVWGLQRRMEGAMEGRTELLLISLSPVPVSLIKKKKHDVVEESDLSFLASSKHTLLLTLPSHDRAVRQHLQHSKPRFKGLTYRIDPFPSFRRLSFSLNIHPFLGLNTSKQHSTNKSAANRQTDRQSKVITPPASHPFFLPHFLLSLPILTFSPCVHVLQSAPSKQHTFSPPPSPPPHHHHGFKQQGKRIERKKRDGSIITVPYGYIFDMGHFSSLFFA